MGRTTVGCLWPSQLDTEGLIFESTGLNDSFRQQKLIWKAFEMCVFSCLRTHCGW